MKSVLISIHPKWCDLIASGKKTIEVRKTRPKIETPFKCYIYCTMGEVLLLEGHRTKATKNTFWLGKPINNISPGRYVGNGAVIGEFVCDCMTPLYNVCTDDWRLLRGGLHEIEKQLVGMAFLTEGELHEYASGQYCFAWHISDLKIYDKPRHIIEFYRWKKCKFCKETEIDREKCKYRETCIAPAMIRRPPQSWCYVAELE